MSFLTAAYLMQTYGPLLTEHELSEVLKLEPGTVRNKRARGGGAWHPLHPMEGIQPESRAVTGCGFFSVQILCSQGADLVLE